MQDVNVDAQKFMDDYAAFEESLEPERQAELQRRQDELKSLLEEIPPEEHGDWWQENWKTHIRWARSECDALVRELSHPDDREKASRKMMDQSEQLRELSRTDPELFESRVEMQVQSWCQKKIEAGRELYTRCERVLESRRPKKYAYLDVPEREVDLSQPREHSASDRQMLTKDEEFFPPPSLPPLTDGPEAPSMTHSEACAALEGFEPAARDALNYFMVHPDDGVIDRHPRRPRPFHREPVWRS